MLIICCFDVGIKNYNTEKPIYRSYSDLHSRNCNWHPRPAYLSMESGLGLHCLDIKLQRSFIANREELDQTASVGLYLLFT